MTPTPTEQVHSRHLLRQLLAVIFGLALVGGLTTACSSDDSDSDNTSGNASDDSYYPHTITTKFGDVTINQKPERILAMSPQAADDLISLGVNPSYVATDPETLQNNFPWMYEDIKDISVADLYQQYEKVASLDPDLIVITATDQETFDRYSEIATTVISNSPDRGASWDTNLKFIAESVNKNKEADEIISDISDKYRQVGSTIEGIEGMSYNWIAVSSGGISLGAGSLLELFGLKTNQNNGQNPGSLSDENINTLDADFIAIYPTDGKDGPSAKKLKDDPMFKELPAAQSGNVYWLEAPEANALQASAPMAMDWLLEKLTPSIEALGK